MRMTELLIKEQTEPGGGIAPAGWSIDLEPKATSGSVRRNGGNIGPSLARRERAFGTSETDTRLQCIVSMVRRLIHFEKRFQRFPE